MRNCCIGESRTRGFTESCALGMLLLLLTVLPAEATQLHTSSEGIWSHQLGHFFFLVSMGILIYWLRDRGLVREIGWRFVQYAALFFILWNLDAMFVHYLDGWDEFCDAINSGSWNGSVHLSAEHRPMTLLYYALKMDHLILLPAIIFLYFGLRRLLSEARAGEPKGEPES